MFSHVFYPINYVHPEFMKWTFPSLNLDISIAENQDVSQKSNWMANDVNSDQTAHYDPSSQDLQW